MNGSPNCPDCGVPLLRSYPECPNCGLSLEAIDKGEAAPQFPLPPEKARSTSSMSRDQYAPPAGNGARLVAAILDSLVLMIALLLLIVPMVFLFEISDSQQADDTMEALIGLVLIGAYFVVNLLYPVVLEASKWQATIGKRVVGLRVTYSVGHRISLGQAIGRNIIKGLVNLIFWPLILVIVFSRRRQGLHDMVAQTFVVQGRA